MKRGMIGVGLLFALLAGGITSSWAMVQWNTPLEETMEQAADFALDGNWGQAILLSNRAAESWHGNWHCVAAFADHNPMEEIDCLFAQLEVYAQKQEVLGYAALCRELAQELQAMGEGHIPNWWNLL